MDGRLTADRPTKGAAAAPATILTAEVRTVAAITALLHVLTHRDDHQEVPAAALTEAAEVIPPADTQEVTANS